MLYAAYGILINYLMRIWYMPHMWYEFKSNVKVGLNILLNKNVFHGHKMCVNFFAFFFYFVKETKLICGWGDLN